jgi:hypothetical protein
LQILWRHTYGAIIVQRTTITLPPELKDRAMRIARMQGISFGELVRRLLLAAAEQRERGGDWDELLADEAVFGGDAPADLAGNHDGYLYGEGE